MQTVLLQFLEAHAPPGASASAKEYRANLSALVLGMEGEVLFLGGDETIESEPTLERLVRDENGNYGSHESLNVSAFIDLPDPRSNDGRVAEIDIEGLANDGGYLWLVGSHSCNRKQPREDEPSASKGLARLAEVERGMNRFFLGRIPLLEEETGRAQLAKRVGGRRAGRLRGTGPDRELLATLARDEHFGPFVAPMRARRGSAPRLPSKDNGLDIEGLEVRGERVFLGLRGPVLRGWACILELQVRGDRSGDLKLSRPESPMGPKRARRYRKHFLNLGGLGIRDLVLDGDDLLILAGPTMSLDGPARIFRWRAALEAMAEGDTLTWPGNGALDPLLDLAVGRGIDHPEGIALLPSSDGRRSLLMVYDSPDPARLVDETGIRADIVRLPPVTIAEP